MPVYWTDCNFMGLQVSVLYFPLSFHLLARFNPVVVFQTLGHWYRKKEAKTRLHTLFFLFPVLFVGLSLLTCMVTPQNQSPPVLATCMVLDTVASRCVNLLAGGFLPPPPHPISSGEKTPWKLWTKSHIFCWKYVDLCSWQNLQVLLCIMCIKSKYQY